MGPAAASSPLFFDRYELKYLIPFARVAEISRYCERYCVMDHYSEISPDQFYVINSLYFDSPNFHLLRTKLAGYPNRFNLRVRSYGADPKPPYFLEAKQKVLGFVKKTRGRVHDEHWSDWLQECPDLKVAKELHQNVHSFLRLAIVHNAAPQVLTQYRRKAYLSSEDDYARVTFDRDLRYTRQTSYSVFPRDECMTNYDHEELFDGHSADVVLELKSPPQMPKWMVDLIRTFELRRVGFSKYASAMVEILKQEQGLSFARSSRHFL